jgi:hypothetical protein
VSLSQSIQLVLPSPRGAYPDLKLLRVISFGQNQSLLTGLAAVGLPGASDLEAFAGPNQAGFTAKKDIGQLRQNR